MAVYSYSSLTWQKSTAQTSLQTSHLHFLFTVPRGTSSIHSDHRHHLQKPPYLSDALSSPHTFSPYKSSLVKGLPARKYRLFCLVWFTLPYGMVSCYRDSNSMLRNSRLPLDWRDSQERTLTYGEAGRKCARWYGRLGFWMVRSRSWELLGRRLQSRYLSEPAPTNGTPPTLNTTT